MLDAALISPNAQIGYSINASIAASLLVPCSILAFLQIVLLMPFRDDGDGFVLDTWRLMKDTLISAFFMVLTFALIYKNIGLILKWSGKFGQRAKMYPTRMNG